MFLKMGFSSIRRLVVHSKKGQGMLEDWEAWKRETRDELHGYAVRWQFWTLGLVGGVSLGLLVIALVLVGHVEGMWRDQARRLERLPVAVAERMQSTAPVKGEGAVVMPLPVKVKRPGACR